MFISKFIVVEIKFRRYNYYNNKDCYKISNNPLDSLRKQIESMYFLIKK